MEGGETRFGRTLWQSVDASAASGLVALGMKYAFSRVRPNASNNPNLWFKGGGNQSFPSGEVTEVSSIVTPLVLEYGHDHPWVYALEALPPLPPAPTACRSASRAARTDCGPCRFPEKVIPLFMSNLIDGETVPLYGEGSNIRDWLHVDDHCRGIHLVLTRGAARRGLQHRAAAPRSPTRSSAGLLLEATGADWEQVVRVTDRSPRPALLRGHLQDPRQLG